MVINLYWIVSNSSERGYTTIGGESSSQQIYVAYLLYYPAIYKRELASKSPLALKTWMKDAYG